MDNLEKVTVLLNDILNDISSNNNDPVYFEKLFDRNVLKKDPGDGSYPDLLTHVIEGCQSTFNNFAALKKDSFFHVRDRSFLDTATRSFLDNYLKYDYEPFLFMQDYGVYKIIVVVKCNVFPTVLINRPVIVFSFMTNVFRTWINVFQITTHF